MAYKNPDQLARLLSALYHTETTIVLHCDAGAAPYLKAELAIVAARYDNLTLLPSRTIHWGTYTIAETHRRAIKLALSIPGWDYFVNLSESCYPIKSPQEILARLQAQHVKLVANEGQDAYPNYVTMQPLSECPPHVAKRYERYWLTFAGHVWPVPFSRRTLPKGIDHRWKGSAWAILHRDFCSWIDTDPISASIWCFLRGAKLPDEFWLQWCLMSSPYSHTQRPNRHMIEWKGNAAHANEFTPGDVPRLIASDALFARKFLLDKHPDILDVLDEALGLQAHSRPDAVRSAQHFFSSRRRVASTPRGSPRGPDSEAAGALRALSPSRGQQD